MVHMDWCEFCSKHCQTGTDPDSGHVSCVECGRVLHQQFYTDEPTFEKGASGESRLAGSYVRSIESEISESYRRTLDKGSREIHDLVVKLTSEGNVSLEKEASCFYKMAVHRGFTRGRRTPLVAASCLYITLRMKKQPYLLIDFAKLLTVNVYVLGAVFLQLCKLLSLEEHPIVQQLVDPSLFMHRYTKHLMKGDFLEEVHRSALKIVSSMKRDWMQTGRKPSGICGAALYISALSHGFIYSKSDILRLVHICEATLTKRLVEFEGTTSASLTIEELNEKAEEYKNENCTPEGNVEAEVLCQHKGEKSCFSHGLCRDCYEEFLDISGGLCGGAEPPAFQRAEMNRLASVNATGDCDEVIHKNNENDKGTLNPGSTAAEKPEMPSSGTSEKYTDDSNNIDEDEDNLSDIDDVEVSSYRLSEKEIRFKTIFWEFDNKDYLKEQAAKQAVAAATAPKKKKRKRAMDTKNAVPPQTPGEAACQMVQRKRFSSRVNQDKLLNLIDERNDVPVKTDDTWQEKQKDTEDDIEQEENEEDIIENDEDYLDDQSYGGEENMYTYDDYSP